MPHRTIGEKGPAFALPDQNDALRTDEEFRGSWVILYFYPKDNTSACTAEALAFSAVYEELAELGVPVLGVSPDSVESHQKFVQKHDLHLILLADPSHEVIEAYGAWVQKKMYGREFMGVERSTFLINPEGVIMEIWRKVRVKDHVEAVSERLRELMAAGCR